MPVGDVDNQPKGMLTLGGADCPQPRRRLVLPRNKMKTCDRCHTKPATSRSAKYCLACRKIRQSENGTVQGKRNAARGMGRINVELREELR